jgi:hypothetical protein
LPLSTCSDTPKLSLAALYQLPEFMEITNAIAFFNEKYGIKIPHEYFERYAYYFVDEVPHLACWHVENLGIEKDDAEKWVDYLASAKAKYQADLKYSLYKL